MDSKGMMAVVRGTPEAGLMVTLVDGGRQYTLMPQAEVKPSSPHQQRNYNMLSQHSQYSRSDVRAAAARRDSGAQAVDDRYTSNYKIEYCHTKPTSPPMEPTEFPLQRTQHQPGQENFQVGGYPLKNFATRTITTQERGSYPVARVSTCNAFENSLRKYPCATPDSSSEVVERLISFTKFTNSSTSPIENDLKLQNCVTCYQVSRKGKSLKYKNTKHALSWKQKSPTRDKGQYSNEGSRICDHQGNTKNTLFCKDIVAMGNVIAHYKKHVDCLQKQQGGNVDSEEVNSAVESTKESLVDVAIPKLEDKLLVATNQDNQHTATPRNENIASFSLQNVSSMQMIKNMILTGGAKRKNNCCKLKKMKSPKPSYTKCKKSKHKPRLCDSEVKKQERKRLKSELLSLIRQFHSTNEEEKLEMKIKTVLFKLMDFTLDTEKTGSLNRDILNHCTKYTNKEKRGYRTSPDLTINDIKNHIKFSLKDHKNDVTEINRIILEEMIPLLKYHIFKEHENKVLKFMLSKVIKDIIGIVKKISVSHTASSKNSIEYRYHLNKLKEISGNKNLLYNVHNTSQVKKYCRYLNAIRKLVMNDASWSSGNGNLTDISKELTVLKLRNVIKVFRALKRIQSTSDLQAQYVTNMLLNHFFNVGYPRNENLNYYGAVRKRTTLKCLSDTYLMLHDTSKNKSVLTKTKIDKMNLYSTKLLTNIKNKCTIETDIEHTERNYPKVNANNPYKQGAIFVNDISLVPLSFQGSKKEYDEKEHNFDIENKYLLSQVEESVNTWLNKFGIDSSSNLNHRKCCLKELSKDLTNQLKQINMNKKLRNIKKENISDCFRCVICKHLPLKFDDHSFELVKNISELIKDLLNICTFDDAHLNQLHSHNQHSRVPEPWTIQGETSLIEDIYLKVPFCNDSVRQVFPKTFSGEDRYNKTNTDESRDRFKYLDMDDGKNRSGVINVALASAKSDKSENTAPTVKCNKTCTANSNKKNSNPDISKLKNNEEPSSSKADELEKLPDNLTRQQLHEYCVEVFRNLCKELPILATKPDLTELAREGVLHNTLKIFYMLQEDSDVEKNCTHFEMCFEDEIDGLLDILPQTEEMMMIRKEWMIKLVAEAVKIFKAMNCTDIKCKNQSNQATSNGRKSVNEEKPGNEQDPELNILRLVDEFLISSNYQENNNLKVKIYIHRLLNRTGEVYHTLKRKDSNACCNLLDDNVNKIVLKELESVPKPDGDISEEEMDFAKLNMEVENWCNKLPIKPTETINDDEKRLRIYQLSKKIYVIERYMMDPNQPPSETDVEQVICMFICNMIDKFDDKDLNINLLIDGLVNSIQKLRQKSSIDYEAFKRDLPCNSTAIQNENIANEKFYRQNSEPYLIRNNTLNQIERNGFTMRNEEENILSKESNISGTLKDNVARLRPIAKTAAKGILGSQLPGTSQDGCCPRPKHSPATASLYTPLTSSTRRNTYESGHLCNKSKWGQFSSREINSNNIDRRASTRYPMMDLVQRPEGYFMKENFAKSSLTPSNFINDPRQASSKILPGGLKCGTTSTAQAPPLTSVQTNDNDQQRYYGNTFQIESERERDQIRIRCRCGDRHYRRRRRYDCCCEDYFSLPHCCLLPYEHYF